MVITCKKCNTNFNIDETLLDKSGSKVRCSICKNVWFIEPQNLNSTLDNTKVTNQEQQSNTGQFISSEIAPNTVKNKETINDTVDGDETIADTVDNDETIADTVDNDETIADTVDDDETIADTVDDDETVADTVDDDETIADTVDDDETIADTVDDDETIVDTVDDPKKTTVPDFKAEITEDKELELDFSDIEEIIENDSDLIDKELSLSLDNDDEKAINFDDIEEVTQSDANLTDEEISLSLENDNEEEEIDFNNIEEMIEADLKSTDQEIITNDQQENELEKELENDLALDNLKTIQDDEFNFDFDLELEEQEPVKDEEYEQYDFGAQIDEPSSDITPPEKLFEITEKDLTIPNTQQTPDTEKDTDTSEDIKPDYFISGEHIAMDDNDTKTKSISAEELERQIEAHSEPFEPLPDFSLETSPDTPIDTIVDTTVKTTHKALDTIALDMESKEKTDIKPQNKATDETKPYVEKSKKILPHHEIELNTNTTPKLKKKSKRIIFFLIFILLIAGAYGTAKYMNIKIPDIGLSKFNIQSITDLFDPKEKKQEGYSVIPVKYTIEGKFVNNTKAGSLFVITGIIKNNSDKTVHHIEVEGSLLSKNNKPVEKTVYCGTMIPTVELSTLDPKVIQQRLLTADGENGRNVNIEPGKSVTFMIVFSDMPENLQNFTVEVKKFKK